MRVSRKGVRFAAVFEGFRPCPYRNHPDEPWTIGYGTTSGSGRPVSSSTPCISKRKARKWLREDLTNRYLLAVPRANRMKQQELDALASFAYNLGPGAVNDPDYSTLAKRLKSPEGLTFEGRKRIYRDEMPRWVMPGSIFEEGLRRRRAAEVRLAVYGDYRP